MKITYNGHSSFKIRTNQTTVVTDPYDKTVGFSFPNIKADIVTVSHDHFDHNSVSSIKNSDYFLIDAPGEYEVSDIMIMGLQTYHDDTQGQERGKNTVFLIESENLVVCHLGDLGHNLSKSQIKQLENTDILCIPVGGHFTIDSDKALKIIKQIEPSIIIPMHFKTKKHAEGFDALDPLNVFIDELSLEPRKERTLSVSATQLPEEPEVVVLE